MTDVSHPLEDLIKPLTFATGEDAPIERIDGLPNLVRAKVSGWAATLPEQSALHRRADAWLKGLARYNQLSPATRKARLKVVLDGILALRAEAGAAMAAGAAPKPRPAPRPAADDETLSLESDVRYLPGVGERRADLLARLGIHRVGDLLLHLPARYEDRSQLCPLGVLPPGEPVTVRARVMQTELKTTARKRMKIFEALVEDAGGGAGFLVLRWFNQPHRARQIHEGKTYLISGKATYDRVGTGLVMENPEFEPWEGDVDAGQGGRVVPIYPLTEGLFQNQLRQWVAWALERVNVPEPLPEDIRRALSLVDRGEALLRVHQPGDLGAVAAGYRRLAFEEFFFLQVGLALKARQGVSRKSAARMPDRSGDLERGFLARLPFSLTQAQGRALAEIQRDMGAAAPMHRLLQGDVGCGKTVVALLALLRAIDNGFQGAIMAPTEVLAGQHFSKMRQLLDGLPVTVALLLGSSRGKKKILEAVAAGEAQLVIGTQALIQDKVAFQRLGLVVIDEQHRFGVRQRARFGAKGADPHTLTMTATPIPRSLAMTVYGDLDLSVIDALPPGRRPVKTRLFWENRRDRVYDIVRREVERGFRAYVVHPLVEASEKTDLRAATAAHEELAQGALSGIPLGLLHGRMGSDEKAAVMADFAAGRVPVLVTTTVVEVGVDVPEATVMVIEHAERFGLSQLHQLRGRVGRGSAPGQCLLVASHAVSADGKERLKAVVESTDGFRIAERDLEIRGPGELFGQRQSGLPELKVANLIQDAALLAAAREAARGLVAADPALTRPEHGALRETVAHLWRHHLKWGAVG